MNDGDSEWQVHNLGRPGAQRPNTPHVDIRAGSLGGTEPSSAQQDGGALGAASPPGNWEDRVQIDLDSCVSWMDSGGLSPSSCLIPLLTA